MDRAYQSSQLDEIEHVVSTTVTPHRLVPRTSDREIDSAFRFTGGGNLAVFDVRYGSRLAVEFLPSDAHDLLGVVAATRGTGQLRLDRKEFLVSRQQGAIVNSGPRETLEYSEQCETRVILMNRRKITEYCAKLLGRDIEAPVQFETQFDMDSTAGQSWLRLIDYATGELGFAQSPVRQFQAAQEQLEQTVITSFLLAHQHAYSEALLRPQAAAAPYFVKRAEAYIEAHFAEPISLAEIAAQAGVSARSLQNGFQSFRGLTPMAFLRSIRLQRAHRALLAADPAISTVTAIAISCGFGHMGEFAVAYRRAFGVSPSHTLSRGAWRRPVQSG